ncbi:thiamine phosphate synthase [Serpentinicella sp. ANB-PHB4]|uniref:thiamine phosphate synthase n=1 Tax=Serpentinicella sp. ANB-PHB4 TaxID=3074076 RepID=UPI002865BCA4|nr:thiamine phosphate synthase [Serpentinicella sp. ANB-PHB4]MDR5658725.1 thiamine phosphate synthase [Serpentinicella sp. ANB-PHB4]
MNTLRIIDANINRVSEGVRVLEDISRFVLNNKNLTEALRNLRHMIRKGFENESLIAHRDAINDIGYDISVSNELDKKENLNNLVQANFKRIQEGLRSIEEGLKIVGHYNASKLYENLRYKAYNLEKEFYIKLKPNLIDTDIYCILGEDFSLGRSNVEMTKILIEAGIKVIQYREKKKEKGEKYQECLQIRKLTTEAGVAFIVNDDADIALAVKADGIHIGQEDMPIKEVRKIVGNMTIGLSTHNPNQAKKAVEEGADYIGAGPVFETKTKQGVEPSQGLDYLKWVSENIDIPYVAIGGIKEANISQVKAHGGKCFAMISEILSEKEPKEKIKQIRKNFRC